MNAGTKYEFLWEDGITYKKPTALSAPLYVEALMSWVQNQLDDEKLFPQKIGELHLFLDFDFPFKLGDESSHVHTRLHFRSRADTLGRAGVPFPKNFLSTCKTILRRLFRVYAHIYYEHFDQICALGIEGQFHRALQKEELGTGALTVRRDFGRGG